MRRLLPLFLCLVLLLSACGATAFSGDGQQTRIVLNGNSASVTGGGVKVSGSVISIGAAGSYIVSGTLDDGQLVVDTGDEAVDVWLTLDNASISNRGGAALYVKQAKNLYLSTLSGTKNRLVSGTEADMAAYDGTQDGAALFSEDDLKLSGDGELEILGYLNNGLTCKDDLDIEGGSLRVQAAGNGLRGSESVEIKGGAVAVIAGNDGIKSSSAKKAGKGYVAISGGAVTVSAQGDGIAAETELTVSGGALSVEALGDGFARSSKALKANTALTVSGGSLALSAIEDAVSCDGNITVSGGVIRVQSENDGLQAGEKGSGLGDIAVSGGDLAVSAVRRALNARGTLMVNGGTVCAFIGTEKQALPEGQRCLLQSLSGSAGDRLTLDGTDLNAEAAFPYVSLLFTSDTLPSGSHELSNGSRTLTYVVE